MKREERLQSAKTWLVKFSGKNVLRGYCKHFSVDWRCAAIELQLLGIHLDPEYLKQREVAEQQLSIARKKRREELRQERNKEASSQHWYDYESLLEAYLAEDYAALHDMECKRDGVSPYHESRDNRQ